MANGGIIGPVNTTEKKKKPKVSVFTASGTLTTDSDTTKINTVIILNKSLEKGHYITKNDLKFEKSFKKNIFYKHKDELIGRKLKQNLRQFLN